MQKEEEECGEVQQVRSLKTDLGQPLPFTELLLVNCLCVCGISTHNIATIYRLIALCLHGNLVNLGFRLKEVFNFKLAVIYS